MKQFSYRWGRQLLWNVVIIAFDYKLLNFNRIELELILKSVSYCNHTLINYHLQTIIIKSS